MLKNTKKLFAKSVSKKFGCAYTVYFQLDTKCFCTRTIADENVYNAVFQSLLCLTEISITHVY